MEITYLSCTGKPRERSYYSPIHTRQHEYPSLFFDSQLIWGMRLAGKSFILSVQGTGWKLVWKRLGTGPHRKEDHLDRGPGSQGGNQVSQVTLSRARAPGSARQAWASVIKHAWKPRVAKKGLLSSQPQGVCLLYLSLLVRMEPFRQWALY